MFNVRVLVNIAIAKTSARQILVNLLTNLVFFFCPIYTDVVVVIVSYTNGKVAKEKIIFLTFSFYLIYVVII